MEKVRIYNVAKYLNNVLKDKQVFRFEDGLAIVVGDNGVLCFDNEGVVDVKNSVEQSICIRFGDVPKNGEKCSVPKYKAEVKIEDLMKAEHVETQITNFFMYYDFNNKYRDSYEGIISAIGKIGLNKTEYDGRRNARRAMRQEKAEKNELAIDTIGTKADESQVSILI